MESESCLLCNYSFSERKFYARVHCDCTHNSLCAVCVLRLICFETELTCPFCNMKQNTLIFSDFKNYSLNSYEIYDEEININFASHSEKELFKKIRSLHCKLCLNYLNHQKVSNTSQNNVFSNINDLSKHLKIIHNRYICNVCVENQKLFPDEWVIYKRWELDRHYKTGIVESSKTNFYKIDRHTECKFCKLYLYDADQLYVHLNNYHVICKICSINGKQLYEANNDKLLVHSKQFHFVCDDIECMEKITVFDNELDLKAHQMQVHNNGLSKSQKAKLRSVNVNQTRNGNLYSTQNHLTEESFNESKKYLTFNWRFLNKLEYSNQMKQYKNRIKNSLKNDILYQKFERDFDKLILSKDIKDFIRQLPKFTELFFNTEKSNKFIKFISFQQIYLIRDKKTAYDFYKYCINFFNSKAVDSNNSYFNNDEETFIKTSYCKTENNLNLLGETKNFLSKNNLYDTCDRLKTLDFNSSSSKDISSGTLNNSQKICQKTKQPRISSKIKNIKISSAYNSFRQVINEKLKNNDKKHLDLYLELINSCYHELNERSIIYEKDLEALSQIDIKGKIKELVSFTKPQNAIEFILDPKYLSKITIIEYSSIQNLSGLRQMIGLGLSTLKDWIKTSVDIMSSNELYALFLYIEQVFYKYLNLKERSKFEINTSSSNHVQEINNNIKTDEIESHSMKELKNKKNIIIKFG